MKTTNQYDFTKRDQPYGVLTSPSWSTFWNKQEIETLENALQYRIESSIVHEHYLKDSQLFTYAIKQSIHKTPRDRLTAPEVSLIKHIDFTDEGFLILNALELIDIYTFHGIRPLFKLSGLQYINLSHRGRFQELVDFNNKFLFPESYFEVFPHLKQLILADDPSKVWVGEDEFVTLKTKK